MKRKIFTEKLCRYCQATFMPLTGRQYTCGAPECIRERRRQYEKIWYQENAEYHISLALARRKRQRERQRKET
jgi:hypothetical protein